MVTISNHRKAWGMPGKTVLITGASSGMGKATAEKLLADGYSVHAAARRVEQTRDLEESGAIALRSVPSTMVLASRRCSGGGRVC